MSNNLNELAKEIYDNSVSKGFYEEPIETGTRLALIHSEVSEALEADRMGLHAQPGIVNYVNDPNSSDEYFKAQFKGNIKDTFEDELADAIIRCLDLAAHKGIDIESHVRAKMRYNSLREHKHGKKY